MAVATAGVVAAAAVGATILGTGDAEPLRPARLAANQPGAGAVDPQTGRLVAAVSLGRAPAQIAAGEDGVWAIDADDRTISKIDPGTGRHVRTFSTGWTPTALAVGAEALWVGNGSPGREFADTIFPVGVSRLDPESGAVDATIALPPTDAHPYLQGGGQSQQHIAVTDDAVWAINPDQTLSRIDPRTNRRVATVPGVAAWNVVAGAEGVWVLEDDGVARIDPRRNTVAERIDVPSESLTTLALGGGALWAADPDGGSVWRIEAEPEPLLRQIPLERGVGGIAFGMGALWVTNEVVGTLSRIDPKTYSARVVQRVAAPQHVAVGPERVWFTTLGAPPSGERLSLPACRDLIFDGPGRPRLEIVSDLPLQGPQREYVQPLVEGIRFVFERRGFRAGPHSVGYRSCDHATAQAGGPDVDRCASNAKAYARSPHVVGEIGAFHSFCSAVQIPIANRAPGGPLAMISPSNTVTGLTRPYRGMRRSEFEELYPTGKRNYFRIAAADAASAVALVQTAKELGRRRIFVMWDRDDADTEAYARDMRAAAPRLGLRVVGAAAWKPRARDFSGLVARVARAGPDAVLMTGAQPPHAGALIGSLRRALGGGVALIASDGFADFEGLVDAAGRDAEGMYVANYGIPNAQLPPAGRAFLREFTKRRHGRSPPDATATYGAQAAEILLHAIGRSDGTRASVVRELRETVVTDGILGDIRFDANGDLVEAPVTIYRMRGRRPVVDRVVTVRTPPVPAG